MKFDLFKKFKQNYPVDELPRGHEDRFADKLDKSFSPSLKPEFKYFMVAASLAALLSISFIIAIQVQKQNQQSTLFSDISGELHEAELFLQNSFQNKLDQLSAINHLDEQVFLDLDEIDKAFKLICSDLKKNPGDERLIRAAFNTYQIKVELLETILSKID